MSGNQVAAGQRATAAAFNNGPPSTGSLVTGSVNSSAAEATIGTFSSVFPANSLSTANAYRVSVLGSADDTATPALTLRLRLNTLAGTQIFSSGAITCRSGVAGMAWALEAVVMFTSTGPGGQLGAYGNFREVLAATSATDHPVIAGGATAVTLDTTAAISLLVTAQWGTSSASNIARTLAGFVVPL